MKFSKFQSMVRQTLCLLASVLIALSTIKASDVDIISFTRPLYHGAVQEKAVRYVVESDVMMGMWLTNITRNVRFDIDGESHGFQARKRILGNFVFLELRTESVSQSRDVRIRALSPDFNQETFCTVRVNVEDINDFQPLFTQTSYEVSINEDTKVGTAITHVKATDLDSDPANTKFYYSLADFTSDYFAVHPITGAVFLTAPLNAKTQSSHSVSIQATDRRAALLGNAKPKSVSLTVMVNPVNAHSPEIVVHKLSSFEDDAELQSGRRVYAILRIVDNDIGLNGQTENPSIIHCDVLDLLSIDRRSNNEYLLLFTQNPPKMNSIINVTVQVSDRGTPPRTSRKIIPVNLFDKSSVIPTFENFNRTMLISELSPISTQVGFVNAKVVYSDQPSNIQYSTSGGKDARYFHINTKTGLITTARRLDRSSGKTFRLTITAVNTNAVDFVAQNNTTVNIFVEDANNHDPSFNKKKYIATISENDPVGTVVTRVHANDEDQGINGSVVYSLINSASLPFAIDSFNGTIYSTASIDWDIFSRTPFDLRVRASDSGLPFSRKSECIVSVHIVNVNDNPPVFNKVDCALTVPVATAENITILQLEPIDIDRNPVTCKLIAGGGGWFKVTPKTCGLQLEDDLSNTESGRRFSLFVAASDGKHTSEPMMINVTVSTSQREISKTCRDTGVIRRFEESMNNFRRSNSQFKADEDQTRLTSTSQLPNRHKPRMLSHASRSVHVAEDLQLQSFVTRIQATDGDTGYNGKLWYTITGGNDESCFVINTESGFIYLARFLDRERRSSYNLTVKVSDMGTPSKSTLTRVNIVVTDVNDNAPVFARSVYTYEIPEDVAVGYQILSRIEAKDRDAPLNARVRYRFSPQSHGLGSFFINPLTGLINITKGLDRESIAAYNLTVIATDSAPTNPQTSTATVLVRIVDVNDNTPKFYRPLYHIQIAEDLPVHTVVFWLKAYDADEGDNGVVRYSLTDGVSNRNDAISRFHVDDRTGAIRLAGKLNSRIQNQYNITAHARDSKQSYSTCYIAVTVIPVNRNLHAPVFEQDRRDPFFMHRHVRIEVSESAAIGTNIDTVSAIDEDVTSPERDVGYYIVDGTGLGIFNIDQNTGAITNSRSLDCEVQQYYWITILAKDRAAIPLTGRLFVLIEVINVNDFAPLPSQSAYFASITESSPVGTSVTKIEATDRDCGSGTNLTYTMPTNKYFEIDQVTGAITTRVKKPLNRENIDISQLSFDVTISDGSSPPLYSRVRVIVNVTDQNDNVPKFYKLIKKIILPTRNRTRVATPIARVVAFDEDAGISAGIHYVLDRSQKFTINPRYGIISTNKGFKAGQISTLKIIAYDRGRKQKSEKTRLQIEWKQPVWSRNPPEFVDSDANLLDGFYFEHVDVAYVMDESTVGRTIGLLKAIDVDSEQLWFSIVAGNEDNMFDIDGHNALYVAGEPDAETKDFYNLTIEVTDGYNKAYKQVTVPIGDINDNRPAFGEKVFQATIDENSPVNKQVIQLTVSDKDKTHRNRNFIFKIRGSVDPASAAKFRIASDGTVYTTTQLDREIQREHILFVEVDDQGVPGALQAYCQVVVSITDKNEHAPQFSSSTYFGQIFLENPDSKIGDDEVQGEVVVRVRATDQDSGENARILYSIESGNSEGFWSINRDTGDITATSEIRKKHEITDTVTSLAIKATDGGKPALASTATVIIDVKTHSSAIPRFDSKEIAVSISEKAPRGSFVTMITATASSGISYHFESGNVGERFHLNPHSGVVSLVGVLDREEKEIYHLVVFCISTEGMRASSHVTVHVTDVNDNRPRFLSTFYIGYVSESNSAGLNPVTDSKNHPLVVSAVDNDSENNAKIVFSIVDPSSEIEERFSVDSDTGAIRAKSGIGLFDYEDRKEYQFRVQCFDLGYPRLNSERQPLITIHVRDANDTIPTFTQSRYRFDLLLPTAEGVVISGETRASKSLSFRGFRPNLVYSISGNNKNSAFKIDSATGLLSVFNPSVLMDGKDLHIIIRVTDGKHSSTAKVTVAVTSTAAEDGLTFTRSVYAANVKENTTNIQDLIAVHIAGMEMVDNVRFRILNPIPSLKIGPTSGVVSTTGVPLDRETKTSYELLVEAVDVNVRDASGKLFRRGRCKVRLNVTDVNDCAPEFIKQAYFATVQVDAAPHSVVKQVEATDADQGMNSVISYALEGKYSRMFNVDSRTGVVTLRRTPDVNVDGGNVKFDVTVVARDKGLPSLVGKTRLVVSVINLATPVFTEQFYDGINVSEDTQPHTVVTDIVKASSPDGSEICYTIEYGDPLQQFDIDFTTGTITTRGTLDHEEQSVYRLRVRARDQQSRAFANVEVELRVTDVNDHSPVFDQSSYSIKLPENASVGTTVVQVKARDQDSDDNGRLAYEIVDNEFDDGGYFHIDQDTGVIWTARSLYANDKKTLSFVVRASDFGAPKRHTDVTVTLQVDDVNNNPPTFGKKAYVFEVSDRAEPGQFVGKVSATDLDATNRSKLTYSIFGGNTNLPLNINSISGVISLTAYLTSAIGTSVTVSDGVYSSSASLEVQVVTEDTSPTPVVFDQSLYRFSVEENMQVGTYVGQISASGLGRLNYRIETQTAYSDNFRLNSQSGRLQTARVIDREAILPLENMETIISITVTAIDSKGFVAKCEVKVKIVDDNDNAPVFTQNQYSAVLMRSNTLKDSVLNISAFDADSDENGRVSYSWYDAPPAVTKVFALDPDEGEIRIRDKLPIGTIDNLSFFVQASDHGSENVLTNVVPVSVHLASDSQSVPRFSAKSYSAVVKENEAVGTEVITVQAFVDNNLKIAYALAEAYVENEDDSAEAGQHQAQIPKFNVDATSGRITTLSPLDREKKASHEITVQAYVKTTPNLMASTKVIVTVLDTNDNIPVFTSNKYRASVVENSRSSTHVITVQANDTDNEQFGKVTYGLRASDDDSATPFVIDEDTGVISITSALDRELTPRYDLVVEARDGGEASEGANQMKISNCHVIVDVVDVNDNPPMFMSSSYQATISEGVEIGHSIPSLVKVKDADFKENTKIRFYIIDGDANSHFEMIPDTDIRSKNTAAAGVKVKLLKKLDRESESSYSLTILATDGLYNATTNLRIIVADVNDNVPVCEQLSYYGSISEGLSPHSFVLRIHATDADIGENGRITYQLNGEGMDAFTLNSYSGELYTAVTLDREITSQYQLVATATDGGGHHCQMQISIAVGDVNDNAPQLVASSLIASARENTPVDSLLHRINAKDSDAGANGSFVFSFLDDVNGQFYIEPNTGVVVLKKSLDRETISSYQLRIKVRDRGNKIRKSSMGTLSLKVLDINDNPPIFAQNQYEARIREDASPGYLVSRVSAKSLDIGANARLRYTISGGNEHGKFSVNENTGEVRLQSRLDYETDQSYVLRISASDLSENPLSGECTLRLNVTDVNDNAPAFTSSYKETLSEDIDIGHLVLTVLATDRDSGSAGDVTYNLSSIHDDLPFRIDSLSGEIIVTSPGLDYERTRLYRITVTATDSGIPPLYTESTIEIAVGDVNDNRPVFAVIASANVENKPTCTLDGANCTVFVHESTIDAVTKGIVKLNATDADGAGNSGPFTFKIKRGNDDDLFFLDSSSILKARTPLKLDSNNLVSDEPQQLVHRLFIEAKDNGNPISLISKPDLLMNIIVLKENQYSPVIAPHHVQIATPLNQFEGDLITRKLHATDEDAFDQNHLHFSMASPADFERYVVDPLSGAVTSLSPLETGFHNVVVRVSDGSRYSNSTVTINVVHVGRKALESSVAITFAGINSVQEYMTKYHSIFVTKLSTILPFGVELKRDLVIISLQTDNENNVQLLFGIRNPSSKLRKEFYSSKSLKRFLETSRQLLMADGSELKVKMIEGTSCSSDRCDYGTCSRTPTLGSGFSVISTDTYSLVTPTFEKKIVCVCPPGTIGKSCESICSESNNPCSKNRVCVVSVDDEANGFRCDPAQPTNTIMTFTGHSYAKYTSDSSADSTPFQISMRIRTYQSNSTLFYAVGSRHFARLETTDGLLQFTFDCGSGPQTMRHDEKYVNDGKWVEVVVESRADEDSNSCAVTMTIDGTYRAGTKALNADRNLEVTSIHFGGMPLKTRGKRSSSPEHEKRDAFRNRVVKHGFRGCLKEVKINDFPLLPTSKSDFKQDSSKNVQSRCATKDIDMGACNQSPCRNSGRCLPLSDGLHECECRDNYYGNSCENVDPCFNLPCNNKGYCYSDGQVTRCVCNAGFIGSRCEIELPSCPSGWKGQHCDVDINECETNQGIAQCGGKEKCFNYDGGFACNCKSEIAQKRSDTCETALKEHATQAPNTALPLWIMIVAAIGVVVLLISVIVVVVCVRKRRRKLSDNSHNRRPPRVPPPPSDYHRSSRDSFPGDPRRLEDQELRNPKIGYVHPHPQLPASPPMSGASDSDSMRKPSPSWPEYDAAKYDESTPLSVRHFPNTQKTSSHSIVDQQSYDWDVSDWKIKGSGLVPQSVARVAVGSDRVRGYELPSSPMSQRSVNSSSTYRSSRGHQRSDALAGHYNKGRVRSEKQILQQYLLNRNKPTTQTEEIELKQMISNYVNNYKPSHSRNDSRNSSLRSASSRRQQGFHPLPPLESPYPSSSQDPSFSIESHSIDVSDEYQQDEMAIDDPAELKISQKYSDGGLPPPPSDYELQVLRGDDDEEDLFNVSHLPSTTNKSFSSLLNSPFNVDLPTPAVARSIPFHSGQHLIDHLRNISDLSLASEGVLDDLNLSPPNSLQNPSLRIDENAKRLEETPSPPQRHDSERLAMSSLSDDEEAEFIPKLPKKKKSRLGRPPHDPKSKAKRDKKKSASKSQSGSSYCPVSNSKLQEHIFIDRPSPGTTDV